ncbi:HNH endonuclease signature motif containing protein [Streptomyces coeruleoprunus]|uniref:HNH endonuclease signature motif containing protein n=1 Tax=Streptomyces coeruleoprunus TaxID=285563 RepID=A0ABV9XGE6_9ACTN
MSTKSKAKGTVGARLDAAGRDAIRERLFSGGVPAQGGCIVWTRYTRPAGYGQMGVGSTVLDVHRVSYALEHGDIPVGMSVLHHCDVRRCFHPGHLYAGTHADNMRDMWERGRGNRNRGLSNGNTRLPPAQVAEIRARFEPRFRIQRGGTRSNAKELSEEYGITPQYVSQLARGLWRVHD